MCVCLRARDALRSRCVRERNATRRRRNAAACGPRSVRTAKNAASASRKPERRASANDARDTLSRPGRARYRAAGGRGRAVSTAREPVTVCRHNLGGRPEAGAGGDRLRFPVEPPISHRPERTAARRHAHGDACARAAPSDACRRRIGLAEYPVYDPQTGVARDPRVTEAAMCVRLVDVRITCGLHDDAQIAAVFIDPRAK